MLFNSFVFVVFAILFFSGWWFAKSRPTLRYIYVIGFSWFFYAYDTPWWLILLVGTGLLDYGCGLAIHHFEKHRKLMLGLSITGNLGLLFYFKYQYFFGSNINRLLDLMGVNGSIPVQQLILPIGISFYTFQSMTYSLGVYKRQMEPTKNILHFLAYISLWPQLVAGPIEKAVNLLPQMKNPNPVTSDDIWDSMVLIARGFFKKMVIADNLAPGVNAVFNQPDVTPSMPLWWVASLMFALQIYGDFSGYTDIARGFARMMGFHLLTNFDHPYGALSITEFWRKWHISLSSWFRDFVYIPLGGNKGGTWKGIRNMWITMLVSGVWHGAAWTFIIWSALHASYLTLERLTNWPEKLQAKKWGRHACALIVFVLVIFAWVFFRANSATQGFKIIGTMLNPTQINLGALSAIDLSGWFFLALGVAMILNTYFGWSRSLHEKQDWVRSMRPVWIGLLAIACLFWRGQGSAFIYFQF